MSEEVKGTRFDHRRLGNTVHNRMFLAAFSRKVTLRDVRLFNALWDDDPVGEDGLRFSETVGNRIVFEAMAAGKVEAGIGADGSVVLVKGRFQDIIDYIIANWDKILAMILQLIELFTKLFAERLTARVEAINVDRDSLSVGWVAADLTVSETLAELILAA